MITNMRLSTAGVDVPIDVAMQRIRNLTTAMNAAAEKMSGPSNRFSNDLQKAVTHKLAGSVVAATSASEESFGQQIKEAVEEEQGDAGLPTQSEHEKRVEQERQRYQQQPPQPTQKR